jgi:hypothetical protein
MLCTYKSNPNENYQPLASLTSQLLGFYYFQMGKNWLGWNGYQQSSSTPCLVVITVNM